MKTIEVCLQCGRMVGVDVETLDTEGFCPECVEAMKPGRWAVVAHSGGFTEVVDQVEFPNLEEEFEAHNQSSLGKTWIWEEFETEEEAEFCAASVEGTFS